MKKKEMFIEAPFISLLIFGLPFGIISIVIYFICCMDTTDQPNSDEDLSDSDGDEQNEVDENLQEANPSDIPDQGRRN
jgi:hypothetical protein